MGNGYAAAMVAVIAAVTAALRFAPFLISQEQMGSIHGIDENIDLSTLAPAVDFYRYILTEA